MVKIFNDLYPFRNFRKIEGYTDTFPDEIIIARPETSDYKKIQHLSLFAVHHFWMSQTKLNTNKAI